MKTFTFRSLLAIAAAGVLFTACKDENDDGNTSKTTYEFSVKAEDNPIDAPADGKTYTIAGADVTGNVVITVNKDLKPVTTTEITFTGSGSADVVGGTTQTADNGQDFIFKLNADADYDYTVKLGTETLKIGRASCRERV